MKLGIERDDSGGLMPPLMGENDVGPGGFDPCGGVNVNSNALGFREDIMGFGGAICRRIDVLVFVSTDRPEDDRLAVESPKIDV